MHSELKNREIGDDRERGTKRSQGKYGGALVLKQILEQTHAHHAVSVVTTVSDQTSRTP